VRRIAGGFAAGALCLITIMIAEAQPAGIIEAGDQVQVRCYTLDQVHVYVTGEVGERGQLTLPGLGAVPMAGRGVQMVRDDLQARYREIYQDCAVSLTIVRPDADLNGAEVVGGQTATPGAAVATDQPLAVGERVLVRCSTDEQLHFNVNAPITADGTIKLPDLAPIDAAGQTVAELQVLVADACDAQWPGSEAHVQAAGQRAAITLQGDDVIRPTVELTAAERFAALPRFGADIFSATEYAADEDATVPADRPRIGAAVLGEGVPPTYIVGPGDELAVRVWTDAIEHIKTNTVVDAEGNVYIELLGAVTVAGQQLADVRSDITARFTRFFDRASVSVAMARTRVIEVRVTGDAQRPGKYTLRGAATLFSALHAAGGPSEIGSLRAVKLLRAGAEPLVIDLYDYLLAGEISGDVPLKPQDTVFIPPARALVGVAGEVRRPARYEMTEETTLADALELAAGIAPTGYAEGIRIWRVGPAGERQILNVSALAEGAAGAAMALRDGDLIAVDAAIERPTNTVELSGAVQRPGAYQVAEGMTVRDLIAAASGLLDSAHTEQASLWRMNEELDYEATRFDLAAALRGEDASNLALAPRDRVIVFSEERVEAPREVQVEGSVRYPSMLGWTKGMRVSDAILQVGGLTDVAYAPRAQILRIGPDQRRAIVMVELAEALTGDDGANVELERGDIVHVFRRSEVAPDSLIKVGGFVGLPGNYERFEGMRASDAILVAGGLLADAGDEVEYAQFGDVTDVAPVRLRLTREGDAFSVDPDPVLADNALVAVVGDGDMIAAPRVVSIKGYVQRPGTYALRGGINDTESVHDLIERAGGVLGDANPNGIVLYRMRTEIIAEEQEGDLDEVIRNFNRELSSANVTGQQQRTAGSAAAITAGLTAAVSEGGSAVVIPPRELDSRTWARAVPINGAKLIESEGREADFTLLNGDVVVVPPMPRTITVMGAVIRSGALAYTDGMRPVDYLASAGGATPDGKVDRLVIIRANGSVVPKALRAEVMPGDVLLVPSDYLIKHINRPGTLERVLSAVGSILTGYLIFTN